MAEWLSANISFDKIAANCICTCKCWMNNLAFAVEKLRSFEAEYLPPLLLHYSVEFYQLQASFSVSSFCVCTLCINCPISLLFLFKEQKVRTVSPLWHCTEKHKWSGNDQRWWESFSSSSVSLKDSSNTVSSFKHSSQQRKKARLKCPWAQQWLLKKYCSVADTKI